MVHRPVRHVALVGLLFAGLAPLVTACGGDDAAEAGSGSGGGYADPGGDAGVTTGTASGAGPSATSGGGETVPPAPSQPPDPEVAACADLDPSKSLVLYLSADDSNSMASPAEAREAIRNGQRPLNPVRTYEFLNYYDVAFPAPQAGQLALFADARAGEAAGAFDLMLAVRAPDAPAERRPMTITFVADTSGSMDGWPMQRERAAMRAIAGQLAPGDIVNVLTWNDDDVVALEGRYVTGPNDEVLLSTIEGLTAGVGRIWMGGCRLATSSRTSTGGQIA